MKDIERLNELENWSVWKNKIEEKGYNTYNTVVKDQRTGFEYSMHSFIDEIIEIIEEIQKNNNG